MAAASFGPGFGQQKLLVSSGTVAVLHFGLYHRGSRRMPDSIFRNMFKTQWFRTSAPTTPSWDHQWVHKQSAVACGGNVSIC